MSTEERELEELQQLIRQAPAPVRQAWTLRKVYNFEHAAIAERMGITLERVDELLAEAARLLGAWPAHPTRDDCMCWRCENARELAKLNVFQRALRKAFGGAP